MGIAYFGWSAMYPTVAIEKSAALPLETFANDLHLEKI